MEQSLVLSLELSQRAGSVAARLGNGDVIEQPVSQGDREKDSVMPAVEEVVARAGGTPTNVRTITIGVGPGGFTGLRIAVATAKMISLTTGATVVPVESAMGVVQTDKNAGDTSIVVSCVKSKNCWLSVVEKKPAWSCTGRLIGIDGVAEYFDRKRVLYGDSFLPEQIRERCEQQKIEVRPAISSATAIMEVGLALQEMGLAIDPIDLLPLYPREPEAVRKWNDRRR